VKYVEEERSLGSKRELDAHDMVRHVHQSGAEEVLLTDHEMSEIIFER
jgi:hypothetical protein